MNVKTIVYALAAMAAVVAPNLSQGAAAGWPRPHPLAFLGIMHFSGF